MQTRAVFFDFGGTLAHNEALERMAGATVHRFAGTFGLDQPPEALVTAMRAAAARTMQAFTAQPFYLFREIFRETFRMTFAQLGVALSDERSLAMYDDLLAQSDDATPSPMDGACETLAALRERGLVTGIVSNADLEMLSLGMTRFGFAEAVDFALCSEEAGSCKPDPGIFREALRRAACAPGEALFVGDQPDQDIAGANRAGLRSVLYVGPGAALAGHIERANLTGDAKPWHTIERLSDLPVLLDARPEQRRVLSREESRKDRAEDFARSAE
jgi:HAD superfamily hydrolase (TIGR01509 family)